MPRLVDDDTLAASSVVANRAMNRDRRLTGRDGYSRVLGVDIVGWLTARLAAGTGDVHWLDLCCGSGRAVLDAARVMRDAGLAARVAITGVDLVDFFAGPAPDGVTFHTASISTWRPDRPVDLITCVHGLHYVGDKLGVLGRATSWLAPDGLLLATVDVATVRTADGAPAGRRLTTALRRAGFGYDGRNRRIRATGPTTGPLPLHYLGADEHAGPNYTGQPAVDSYYEYRENREYHENRGGAS